MILDLWRDIAVSNNIINEDLRVLMTEAAVVRAILDQRAYLQ